MPGVDLHQFMVDLRDFVVNWWPLLGLTFYCVLLYIFWRMLQLMPRVKPATVIVDPRTAIDWNDIAGADEAKMELAEIVEFLRDPKRFEQLGAVVPKGVLLYGPPGARNRHRVRREVLCAERLRVRRDVRGSRRGEDSQALRRGAQERALDHLHR